MMFNISSFRVHLDDWIKLAIVARGDGNVPELSVANQLYDSAYPDKAVQQIASEVSESERRLYSQIIMRALQDVMNGATPERQAKAATGRRADVEAVGDAEDALGWIMDDSEGFGRKRRCDGEPCTVSDQFGTYLCNSYAPSMPCSKVTFREACRYQEPQLSPEAVRKQLLSNLRRMGAAFA